MPKLRRQTFETAIIERYRRREASVEEALIEMYLAGVSVRRVEDITEALWGTRVSPSTVSDLNKKIYATIETWRNRPIEGEHPYVYLDGIVMKRSWAGEVRNVSLLVAIAVNSEGYREILGIVEGAKEDKAGWSGFLKHSEGAGAEGRAADHLGCVHRPCRERGGVFPGAGWQRCVVHFYRNVFSHVPRPKMREVAAMLKAIHAARTWKRRGKRLCEWEPSCASSASQRPPSSWRAALRRRWRTSLPGRALAEIRTNNPLERILREIRRRTRVVGAFPDGQSALNLAAHRCRTGPISPNSRRRRRRRFVWILVPRA